MKLVGAQKALILAILSNFSAQLVLSKNIKIKMNTLHKSKLSPLSFFKRKY